jgi:hypothetical protein
MNDYVRFVVLTAVITYNSIFWDVTPCSPLKVNRRFGRTYLLHFQDRRLSQGRIYREASRARLVSYVAYSSVLKIEETYPSETSADFQWATRHYIPEVGMLFVD